MPGIIVRVAAGSVDTNGSTNTRPRIRGFSETKLIRRQLDRRPFAPLYIQISAAGPSAGKLALVCPNYDPLSLPSTLPRLPIYRVLSLPLCLVPRPSRLATSPVVPVEMIAPMRDVWLIRHSFSLRLQRRTCACPTR